LRLAASAFANSYDGIMITDAHNVITEVNPAFTRITGYEAEEVVGKSPRMLGSGRQGAAFYAAMWQALQTDGHWSGEVWNRRKTGELYAEILSIAAVKGDDGELSHYLAVFSDITRLKAHEAELAHIAQYDMLTGVPNRRLLGDRMKVALARARRDKLTLAVCMLDLDGFKEVNDLHGHDVGDQLLVEIARRLLTVLREDDTLARLGGDEFVLLLANLRHPEESHGVLERMLRSIAQPMAIGNAEVQVSASIGLTLYPHDDADPDTLLRHADQAMYTAKQEGKNRYHLFDPEHDKQVKVHREQLQRLEQALTQNELLLYYQPKVNLRTGVVVGAEALLRWQHPELGLRAPGQFLQLVTGQPFDIALGEWVIETALSQLSTWLNQGTRLEVSVNISADHLLAEGFVAMLTSALARHRDVAPQQLELEILETAAIGDLNSASQVVAGCRALGVRFALDDFGTGYSSLAYFRNLSVDLIKIDQSFVRDMLDDPNDLGIVDSVVRLAQAFNRPVIAEGVETLEHGAALLLLGCTLAQGYGVARPMPAEQLVPWLAQWQADAAWQQLPEVCTTTDKLALRAATRSHHRWMASVNQTIEAVLAHQDAATDFPTCRFGHWFRSSGGAQYGLQAAFIQLGLQHDAVHRIADELLNLARMGRADDARHRMPELTLASDFMVGTLGVLMAAGEGCRAVRRAPGEPVDPARLRLAALPPNRREKRKAGHVGGASGSAHQQHGHLAVGQHLRGHRPHHQIAQRTVAVRAHHDQVKVTLGCGAGNLLTRVAHRMNYLGGDAVAAQELEHWCVHLGSLFLVVPVSHIGPHGRPGPGRQRSCGREHGERVVRAKQFRVCDQVRQHLFGKGAAINGKQNLHVRAPAS
jgi:diguanylate cyclase (GGDEF)-like protein/PAS domain S-box-containing protein